MGGTWYTFVEGIKQKSLGEATEGPSVSRLSGRQEGATGLDWHTDALSQVPGVGVGAAFLMGYPDGLAYKQRGWI